MPRLQSPFTLKNDDLKNYYAILEVPVGCSLEEIRQAYHRLVQEHLDDEAVFADLKEAYEVLSTPSRRADYDLSVWGETFNSSSASSAPPLSGSSGGRCPMGAEAQCPVLQARIAVSDKFCPECGYLLAGLNSEATFDLSTQSSSLPQVWLEERGGPRHPLQVGINTVGRESADVLVPDKTVSRSHARLELHENGGLTAEDLGSTNGTQVNEELLLSHVPRQLADGDRLRFGSVVLTLHLPSAASVAPEVETPDEGPTALPPPVSPTDILASAEARAQVTEMRDGEGRVFPLPPGMTTFGRRAENSVVLTGDLYVSGSHAQIQADGDVYILTDLGSTNGTLLNGERLQSNTPVSLDPGDVIVIGGTALRFARLGPDGTEIGQPDEAAEPLVDLIVADGTAEDVEG